MDDIRNNMNGSISIPEAFLNMTTDRSALQRCPEFQLCWQRWQRPLRHHSEKEPGEGGPKKSEAKEFDHGSEKAPEGVFHNVDDTFHYF